MHINGKLVRGEPTEGRYFLLRVADERYWNAIEYELRNEPGRTNQSGAERLTGWLGTTDNVARYADGAVEVYRDAGGRLRARRIDAQALLAEDNSEILPP